MREEGAGAEVLRYARVRRVSRFRYRAEVLAELERMGIRPTESTDPGRVREFVNDLYRFEIRRVRSEIVEREAVEGRKLRGEYSERVTFLRDSYPVLSRPAMNWVDRDGRS